eukprot:3130457-Amphidinium_carterae.1
MTVTQNSRQTSDCPPRLSHHRFDESCMFASLWSKFLGSLESMMSVCCLWVIVHNLCIVWSQPCKRADDHQMIGHRSVHSIREIEPHLGNRMTTETETHETTN